MLLKKKSTKILLFTVILLPVLIFAFNYFLAYRLENHLKKVLVNRVSEATDNFYMLSYDTLSISLFNGELKIKGIEFKPAPITFQQWQSLDSLPEMYYKAKISAIDFKGINLIWRWSYKHLNFNTFEIKSPTIEVFNAYHSSNFEKKVKNTTERTLYELIEPYIDVITVKTLNLEHASVSYNVENPQTPINYKLEDVSFHAYGFKLDSLSSKNGKLLYSDNFDFVTNQHQTLLTNNEFSLLTDSIKLSTEDSIIYLENIHLLPQEKLWEESKKKPTNYIDGQISKVVIDGIVFKRAESLNYLEANNFGVYSPNIKVYNLAPNETEKKDSPKIDTDSLIQSLSLYELISPILYSVCINQISLEKTKADYFYAYNNIIETYHLDNFDFHAYDFLVDSLSEANHTFWYSDHFTFEATGLKGAINARNHNISVGRIDLDTEKGAFNIEDIHLTPISINTPNDYLEGNVKSVNIEGLMYNNGINADLFKIESPNIRYIKVPTTKRKRTRQHDNQSHADIHSMLNPILKNLSINDIMINNVNVYYADKNDADSTKLAGNVKSLNIEKLLYDNGINAKSFKIESPDIRYAKNPSGKKKKRKHSGESRPHTQLTLNPLMSYLSVQDFNINELNLLYLEKNEADSAIIKGNVKSVNIEGFRYEDGISANLFEIESPDIRYVKNPSAKKKEIKQSDKNRVNVQTILNPFLPDYLSIQDIKVNKANVVYLDKSNTDPLSYKINGFNFFATDFLINDSTSKRKRDLFFDYRDFGFNFHNFDNHILHNAYRVIVDHFVFSTFNGFRIENIELIPLKKSDVSISLKAPLIEMEKPVWDFNMDNLSINKIQAVSIDEFKMMDAEIGLNYKNMLFNQKINLGLTGLNFDNKKQAFDIKNINFNTKNIDIPLSNGIYNLHIGGLSLSKNEFKLDDVQLNSPYSKDDFAFKHPKHSDWLIISAKDFALRNIDFSSLISDKVLIAEDAEVNKLVIETYKNKQIPVPKKFVPMIYEGIQKAPLKIEIDSITVNDMEVVYEELAVKGTIPGKIFFTEMNGVLYNFTNIVKRPDQYIELKANAKLMGSGFFTGEWMIPVDSLNDHFLLKAHLPEYDLTTLNELITPLAPIRIRSGEVDDLTLTINASSHSAEINMQLLYSDLIVDYLKVKNGVEKKQAVLSSMVNSVVRNNNPRREGREPHVVYVPHVERNPNRSTFNYIWRILQPAVADAAGISQGSQKFAANTMEFFNKIKLFFSRKKNEEETDNTEEQVQE